MIFTYEFTKRLREKNNERGHYVAAEDFGEKNTPKWRRPVLRGLLAAVLSDIAILIIIVRLLLGSCSPLLLVLLSIRSINPMLSVLYHGHDINVFTVQERLQENTIRKVDMFFIIVATTVDLTYAAYILMKPECLPIDMILCAIVVVLTLAVSNTSLVIGAYLLRAAYLGFMFVPWPAKSGVIMTIVGILLYLIEYKYYPDQVGTTSRTGVAKYFGLYDLVHVCWFTDLAIMLMMGDAERPNLIGSGW